MRCLRSLLQPPHALSRGCCRSLCVALAVAVRLAAACTPIVAMFIIIANVVALAVRRFQHECGAIVFASVAVAVCGAAGIRVSVAAAA